MNRSLIYSIFHLFLLIFMLFPGYAYSQAIQVPINIQTAFFGKIFNHVSPLNKIQNKKILIVYDTKSESNTNQFIENMTKLGFDMKAVKPDQLVMNIDDYHVVYFMPGLQEYAKHCRLKKKLSICGVPKYTEQGDISIALGIENDRPQIFLNIEVLQAEGNDISVELLQISKVY